MAKWHLAGAENEMTLHEFQRNCRTQRDGASVIVLLCSHTLVFAGKDFCGSSYVNVTPLR
jgi:hypothetical protein